MNDLIDELTLIAWNSEPKNATTIVKAIALLKKQESIIDSLKSDLSETLDVVTNRKNIVRCRDCTHNDDADYPCERHTMSANAVNDENWFCADGIPKEVK